MAYPVNKIADYIIEYAANKKDPINNLKLQKVLYYLEARFLVEKRISLFKEDIEKWRYGPVVPKVYFRFNHLGAEAIESVPIDFDFMLLLDDSFTFDDIEPKERNFSFSSEDEEMIVNTIESLWKYDPFSLVDETHKHRTWLEDEKRILAGVKNIKYKRSEIKKEFEDNPEFKIWSS